MNDKFLIRFRKPPPREFAAALYERINTDMNTQRSFAFRRMTVAAALCLALIGALAFSPSARAAIATLFREIGGITFIGPDETSDQEPASPDEEVTVPEETLTLDEARAKLPYTFNLPTWVPEGYVLGEYVRITYFPNNNTPVSLTWMKPQEVGGDIPIILVIGPRVNWLVDLDSVEEVQINGQPAGLVGGGWNADTGQWESDANLALTWMKGDVMYQLRSPGATVEELIQMAESIP